MRRVSGRLLPPLRWHGFAAALWLGGLVAWAPLPVQAQTTDPSATYQVTFEGTWTTAATPGGVPGSAHFTTLIGATHNDSVTFWEAGGTATQGIESVAEIGGTSTFKSEINASAHAYRVAFFNPGSNVNQVSSLRLLNDGGAVARVSVTGTDDRGAASDEVRLTVAAEGVRTVTAAQLEAGAPGLSGALGDGAGKWRLLVRSDRPIRAMSLLESPAGHLTNLSTAPEGRD